MRSHGNRLDVAPHQAVFLDDSPACIAGAQRVGMTAITFLNTKQAITDLNAALGTRPERMTPSAPAKSPRYGATGRRLIVRRIQRWSANALAGCRLAPEVRWQTGAGRSLAIAPLWLPRS
jgi:hypothetical protein